VYLACINDVAVINEMRIESRQRYLRQQTVDWEPTPMRVAPPPYVPPPAASVMPPTTPTPMAPVAPFVRPAPAPHVLCIGQVAIPGGSNAEGMRMGCQ
jgi:hypothetical protein